MGEAEDNVVIVKDLVGVDICDCDGLVTAGEALPTTLVCPFSCSFANALIASSSSEKLSKMAPGTPTTWGATSVLAAQI